MREVLDEYKTLCNIVCNYGEHYPKKHGEWITLRIKGENTFFSLDTWNGALHYKVGSGDYNYHTGFKGASFFYFGLNASWGGCDHCIPKNVYAYYIAKARANSHK